jgi:hypothetical protein
LEALRTRAIDNGWFNTLLIIIITQAQPLPNIKINVLDNYGLLTEVMTRTHAESYMFFNNRAAQDSHNLYHCLESSLTPEARQILCSEQHKFTFRRADAVNAPVIPNSDPEEKRREEKRRDGLMFCGVSSTAQQQKRMPLLV